MVIHSYDPSTQEAEVGRSAGVQGQAGLCSEFKASLTYKVRPYLKKVKKDGVSLLLRLALNSWVQTVFLPCPLE